MNYSHNRSAARFLETVTNGDLVTCKKYFQKYEPFTWNDIRNEFGCNALHLAAASGHNHIVQYLLDTLKAQKSTIAILRNSCGGNPVSCSQIIDDYDESGCTALQKAAANGHENVVRSLIKSGAQLDSQDKFHGNNALHEAAWKGYSFTVMQLLEAGSSPMLANSMGFTALHLCCQNGHNQTCRELLLAGANPNFQNNYGDTALHTAARYGHAGVMRILISAKCDVLRKNENGDTALHISAAMGKKKLTRILLEANCDKRLTNKQNETARDIAVRKKYPHIVQVIDNSPSVPFQKAKLPKVNTDESSRKNTTISPYGCFAHGSSDSKIVPEPKLNSLPKEPLHKGEQYFIDLSGKIHKGPISVGYQCFCAPFLNHIDQRLTKNTQDIKKHLDSQVLNLENRLIHDTAVERARCEHKYQQIESKLLKIVSSSAKRTNNKKSKAHQLERCQSLESLAQKEDGVRSETKKELVKSNDELNFESDTPQRTARNFMGANSLVDKDTSKRLSVAEIVTQLEKSCDLTCHKIGQESSESSGKDDDDDDEGGGDCGDDDNNNASEQQTKDRNENKKKRSSLKPDYLGVKTNCLAISSSRSRNAIYDSLNSKTVMLYQSHETRNSSQVNTYERDTNDSGYSKGNSPSLSSGGHLELFDNKNQQFSFGSSSLV